MPDLYTSDINEFVDWKTGINSVTNEKVTDGKSVSGGSIRNLILTKLRNPFKLYQNTNKGKYQIFSSDDAQSLYEGGGHEDLLLGEFEGPSGYKIKSALVTNEYNYLTKSDNGTAQLVFKWVCINSSDETWLNTYTNIKITVVNNGIKIWDYSDGNNNQQNLNEDGDDYQYKYILDIYSHLLSGTNYVTVSLSSDAYGAVSTLSATYNVISFLLSEDLFDNFSPITSNSIRLRPQYTISTDNTASIQIYIDDTNVYSNICITNEQITISKSNLEEGPHLLIMYLSTQIQGTEYRSNILVKKFVRSYSAVEQNATIFLFTYTFVRNELSFIENLKQGDIQFNLTQYSKFSLLWGLYNVDSSKLYSSVKFYISDSSEQLENEISIGSFVDINANILSEADLTYSPRTSLSSKYLGYIIGSGAFKPIGSLSINEFSNASLIKESTSYSFKFDAFGKNNQNNFDWKPTSGIDTDLSNVEVAFNNISFTRNNGWYQDSFRTQGEQYSVSITGLPFDYTTLRNSFTFEIDFYTENINSNSDLLVDVGGFIKIYPNKALMLDNNGKTIIETNFKSEERIKISFIKYPETSTLNVWSNLFVIVTNGIMERGASSNARPKSPTSNITIGGTTSGIRVYNMRYYTTNLDWRACYNNWIYDSDEKADIISRNGVYFLTGSDKWLGEIDESKCTSMMDTILIEGDLTLLVNTGLKLGMRVDSLTRLCPTDATKNFTISDCYVRTHGQSNIEYPVPSFKFWSNKKQQDSDPDPVLTLEKIQLEFCKGRMQVYNGAIPANKWVLQSNFADSSCCHNATFMRKIQDLWYNAAFTVNGKVEYRLRTPPLLFSSSQTITPLDNGLSSDTQYNHGYNAAGKLWKDYAGTQEFPYTIRVAPNSFPCILFYRSSSSDPWTFFGQYVFMDDKKSDNTYGERSIYYYSDPSDPFVLCRRNIPMSNKNPDGLRDENAEKYNKSANRIWDNNSVIRIEVLDVDGDEVNFIKNVYGCAQSNYYTTWNDDRSSRVANTSFELIYPDIDDLSDALIEDNYNTFLTFLNWVVSTNGNNTKFLNEAAQHMDLYKIGAYYIFCMVYGLVDSMNRNVQWKTYDGIHWHMEPWDMDVALGCQNNGGIAYDPPIDRTTEGSGVGIGAFSGINSTLWNNLEAWDYWRLTVVPAVAQALYEAGMTYDSMIDMFDNTYATSWPEYIYNKSGEYKYIYSGVKSNYVEPKYLPWMQGSRITHRHWWLATSMDYWYSKFGRGAFTANHIKVDTNIPPNLNIQVKIVPSQKGFFAYFFQQGGFPEFTVLGYDDSGLKDIMFTINESFSTKKPFYLCGLSNILKLDISDLGSGFAGVNLNNSSPITEFYIGATTTDGKLNYVNLTTSNFNDFANNIPNLQTLDITGQHNLNVFTIPSSITKFYGAASSYVQGFTATSNTFDELVLPNKHVNNYTNQTLYLGSLILKDVSWKTIKFANTTNSAVPEIISYNIVNSEGEIETVTRELYTGTYEETSNLTILFLELLGKTCKGTNADNARDLVISWINSDYSKSLSDTDKLAALKLENVDWTNVSYADVITLSQYYNVNAPNIRGKIVLSEDEEMSTDKLSVLQELFGDTVFTLGSNGLVIDYPLSTQIISVGNPAVYKDGIYTLDESVGKSKDINIKINYVKFSLLASSNNLYWELQSKNNAGDWVTTTTLGKPSVTGHSNISLFSVIDSETETTTYYIKITESDTSVITDDYTFRLGIRGSGIYVTFIVTPVKQSLSFAVNQSSINIKDETDDILFRDEDSKLVLDLVKGGNSYPIKVDWAISGAVVNYINIDNSDLTGCTIGVSQMSTSAVTGTLKCTATYVNGYKIITKVLKVELDLLILNSDYPLLIEAVLNAFGDNTILQVYQSDLKLVKSITFDNVFSYYTKTKEYIFKYLTNVTSLTIKNDTIESDMIDCILDRTNLTKSFAFTLDGITLNGYTIIDILPSSNVSDITILNCDLGLKASNKTINISLDTPTSLDINSIVGTVKINTTDYLTSLSIQTDNQTVYEDTKHRWLSLIPTVGVLNKLTLYNTVSLGLDHYLDYFRRLIKQPLDTCNVSILGNILCYAYHKLMDQLPSSIYNALVFSNYDYYYLYNIEGDASKEMYDSVLEFAKSYYGEDNIGACGLIDEGITNQELLRYTATNGNTITLNNLSNITINAYQSKNGTLSSKNFLNTYFNSFTIFDLKTCSCDPHLKSSVDVVTAYLGNPTTVDLVLSGTGSFTIEDSSSITNVNLSGITNIFTLVNDQLGDKVANVAGLISGTQIITSDSDVTKIQNFLNNVYKGNVILSGTITANTAYISQTKYDAIIDRCKNLTLTILKAYEPYDPYTKMLYDANGWTKANLINNKWNIFIKNTSYFDIELLSKVFDYTYFNKITINGEVWEGTVCELCIINNEKVRVFPTKDFCKAIVTTNSSNTSSGYLTNFMDYNSIKPCFYLYINGDYDLYIDKDTRVVWNNEVNSLCYYFILTLTGNRDNTLNNVYNYINKYTHNKGELSSIVPISVYTNIDNNLSNRVNYDEYRIIDTYKNIKYIYENIKYFPEFRYLNVYTSTELIVYSSYIDKNRYYGDNTEPLIYSSVLYIRRDSITTSSQNTKFSLTSVPNVKVIFTTYTTNWWKYTSLSTDACFFATGYGGEDYYIKPKYAITMSNNVDISTTPTTPSGSSNRKYTTIPLKSDGSLDFDKKEQQILALMEKYSSESDIAKAVFDHINDDL